MAAPSVHSNRGALASADGAREHEAPVQEHSAVSSSARCSPAHHRRPTRPPRRLNNDPGHPPSWNACPARTAAARARPPLARPQHPPGAVLYAVIAGLIVWITIAILSHVHIIISWH